MSAPSATHVPLHEWARNLNAHAESVEALAGPERLRTLVCRHGAGCCSEPSNTGALSTSCYSRVLPF